MTAAEFELLSAAQAEAILVERYRRLTEAGYPPESALLTASLVQIDLARRAAALGGKTRLLSLHHLLRRRPGCALG